MQLARARVLALSVGVALSVPLAVQSATKTTTFKVTATIQSDCTVSASDLNFGTLGLLGANVDQTSTITLTCTNGAAYSLGLDAGSGTGSTIADRKLANGATSLSYQLYRDSNRMQLWGNTPATDTANGTGTGTASTVTVYGRVPPQSTPAAGSYTSTIIVTITY